jgi:hypothetical protein
VPSGYTKEELEELAKPVQERRLPKGWQPPKRRAPVVVEDPPARIKFNMKVPPEMRRPDDDTEGEGHFVMTPDTAGQRISGNVGGKEIEYENRRRGGGRGDIGPR